MKAKIMALAVASALADLAAAQALPTGGTVTRGSAEINTSGSAMTVNQTTQRAIIDWTNFNIGHGASVNFTQLNSSSIAVNRVGVGGGASAINGTLGANGNVMILNPNGVMFGATAVVNVAGLIASTGNINDNQFMASDTASIAITGATSGSVSNAGNITITNAGLAAFVAPSVSNAGQIVAQTGRITLASAQAATVSFNGGLYEIAVDQGIAGGSITNTGTLNATGGTIVLSALDAANVVSGAINLSGIQQANRIEVHGGQVTLRSDLDATTVAGTSRLINVCDCAQIQDAVNIAKSGAAPGDGATVNVDGGTRAEQVTIDKAYLTLTGQNDATVTIGAGQTAFNIAANGVTVEDMKIVGPYGQAYTLVDWNAQPNITAGFTVQPGVQGATIRGNEIRNVRAGVLMLGAAPGATITGNLIDNTKGSILVRTDGASISGNRFGAFGNEWDVVFLNGVSDGAYFTSPHASQKLYGDGVMAMSADNNGMHILDRRYGSNGLLGSTPQFGNRSHVAVSAGSSFTALDDFNLGNGLGNARQPLGSIATGIDAAVWGGFVDVAAGTYAQSSTLNVNKSVTLTGAGEAHTIIDAHGVSGYGMLVTADDVSLSHFTLHGPQANVGSSYGIKVEPGASGAAARVHDFSISHVTSRGAGRAELDLNGVVGATIDHFSALGDNSAGAGIQITDSANVTISNSKTEGNNWGGVALFQANRFFDQQVTNVTVQDNNTFTEANPLYLQDESASRNFGALSLLGFDYALRNSANSQFTWLQYDLGNAVNLALSVGTPASSYIQGWDGSSATQNFHVGAGMSIMKAVNEAAAGAIVNVGAGLYAEQLTVTKNLTLAGAGSAVTTVTPTALTADPNGARSILTIGGGADVEVSGFTFKGPVPELTAGIFVREGAHAHIHHNAIVDARESAALSGNQRGVGIWVGRATVGTSGTALIENNTISGYQKGGIVVDGPGSQATITGNTVTGEGPTTVIAQNGIQVSRGASATISGNTVSGNHYTPASDEATGILIFTPGFYLGQGTITVGPNNVSGNEAGVWTNDPATLTSINLSGVTGNVRNGVADFGGGFATSDQFLKYPAWAASSSALVSASAFGGTQTGDMLLADGALRVSGWSGFSNIQPAINAVATGGNVNVAAGTYTQSSTLNVTKSVTITGAGEAHTLIDASGVSGYGMLVTADDVSLSHFTLYGPQANAGTSYGIKVQPGTSGAAARLHDFSVSHVTSRGAGRAELDLNGVVGATIDHFSALGDNTAGAGIQITDSANVTISNSVTEGNNWGGVALYQANRFFNQQMNDITVESNNTFNESNPLYMQDESTSRDFGALSLQGFQYAVRNSANDQYTWLQYNLGNAVGFAVGSPAPLSSYIQSWDGSARTQNFFVGSGMSITHALAQGASGAAVNVGAGSYAEDVVVNSARNLTFGGATLQSLTVNAAGSGIGGSATASGAGGFQFNAPVVLLSDTSLSTGGANIVFNGDVQNAGTTPFALNLSAGSGDVLMVSGGSAANPLGHLDVAANNFSLAATMWVSGYEIDAAGSVALSTSTLRSVGSSNTGSISAVGDITGSTVTEGAVDIQSNSSVLMTNIISSGPVVIEAANVVAANIETPTELVINSGGPVQVTGSAPIVVLDAPAGDLSGSFGSVTNTGTGVIAVNGKAEVPQTLASSYDPSRVVPPETSGNAAQVAASEDDSVSFSTSEEERRATRIVRAAPQEAKSALDSGLGVELDLSPRNTR